MKQKYIITSLVGALTASVAVNGWQASRSSDHAADIRRMTIRVADADSRQMQAESRVRETRAELDAQRHRRDIEKIEWETAVGLAKIDTEEAKALLAFEEKYSADVRARLGVLATRLRVDPDTLRPLQPKTY